jgi:hypothetical protein
MTMPSGVHCLTIFMKLGKNNMPIEAPQHFMFIFPMVHKAQLTHKLVRLNTASIAYFWILTTLRKITDFCYSNIHVECTHKKKKTWQPCENSPWLLVWWQHQTTSAARNVKF